MPEISHDETGTSYLSITVAAFIFDESGRLLLIRENYGQRRYGPPGGRMEAGESPLQAVIREAREEICVEIQVEGLIGIYYFAWEPWLAFGFHCHVQSGQPAIPQSGEIAEVGWFRPDNLPSPVTNLLPRVLPDAVGGARGLVRDYLQAPAEPAAQ
ncbi:MAG: NUDIX hydrolase [Chloroflexota bacterium]|nr:NUDIX hydrolase [Chloroflexota bacterium]